MKTPQERNQEYKEELRKSIIECNEHIKQLQTKLKSLKEKLATEEKE